MATPGVDIAVTNPPSINIGGRGARSPYQYTLRGSDIQELYRQGERLLARLQDDPMLSVNSNLLNRSPIVKVHIDRERALSMGTTPSGIEQALANAYNQQQVSTIFMPTNQYMVVMETVPSAQVDATVLEHFYVPAAGGRQIPLSEVATFEQTTGPLSVAHSGQMASMTISFNLARACRSARRRRSAADRATKLPGSITGGFSGHRAGVSGFAEGDGDSAPHHRLHHLHHSRDSLRELHPPGHDPDRPAVRGVRRAVRALRAAWSWSLRLCRHHMLIGIVKKNAIMMIDFALERQRQRAHTAG